MTLYITGLNGSIENGLGKYLLENQLIDSYIEVNQTFQDLKFQEQISIIQEKLDSNDESKIKVIAVSYGAYLLLNSLIEKSYNIVSILLLSPVLGQVSLKTGGRIPINLSHFKRALQNNQIKLPIDTKIVYGTDDFICTPGIVNFFSSFYDKLTINPIVNEGHNLPHDLVQKEIKNFLN